MASIEVTLSLASMSNDQASLAKASMTGYPGMDVWHQAENPPDHMR
jgi:hypothetical protein